MIWKFLAFLKPTFKLIKARPWKILKSQVKQTVARIKARKTSLSFQKCLKVSNRPLWIEKTAIQSQSSLKYLMTTIFKFFMATLNSLSPKLTLVTEVRTKTPLEPPPASPLPTTGKKKAWENSAEDSYSSTALHKEDSSSLTNVQRNSKLSAAVYTILSTF